MSYFVLTPVTNLGNLLSTESISPAALYETRNYGFRFFDQREDDVEGAIRMYAELPPQPTDEEGRLFMALELDETLVRMAQMGEDGTLWTAETIRFTPSSCRFVFYSEGDLRESFNAVHRSIEAKFASSYRAGARAASPQDEGQMSFDGLALRGTPPEGLHMEDVARFERLDRMKGAIFGYCLGFCYSLPRDKGVQDMCDEYVRFWEIVDDLVNSVTQVPVDSLEGHRRMLEAILYKFLIASELQSLRQSAGETFDLGERIERIRRRSTVELPASMTDSFGLNEYRSELEDRIREAKDNWRDATPLRGALRPRIEPSATGPKIKLPKDDGPLASDLLNKMIRADFLKATNRVLGYPFALECGKAVRSCMGDSWDASEEREYVNELLVYINDGSEFDPTTNPGIEDERSFNTLRLVAHLCERRDNKDLDCYYRYLLIRCKTKDFALPFCLWGAAFGFSAMPKTLFDSMSPAAEACARKLFDEVLNMVERQDGVAE